jgi:cyclic beta-1,2-glucan synthetase
MCDSRDQAIQLISKYGEPNIFTRETNLGWVKSQITLRHLNISMRRAHLYQRIGSQILYLSPSHRAQSVVVKSNRKQQPALWAHGISGDYPILLIRIHDEKNIPFVRELLHAHEYLRLKGLSFDLVILNEHKTTYLQTLQDEIMRQILISGGHYLLEKPGGIFIKRADHLDDNDLNLLKTLSRVQFRAELGSLEEQLNRTLSEKSLPPLLIKTKQEKIYPSKKSETPPLLHFNSLGGFSENGK